MNAELAEKFKFNLSRLVGKECFGIVDSDGSRISFDFGNKILRKKPIGNQNLSEDVNVNTSELSFLVYCVWRIESKERVICGSWSESKEKAKKILGQKVTEVELDEPSFDLSLTFSNDFKLKVFCDSTNELDEDDNYYFFTDTEIYSVEMYSQLTIETREIEK